jgi:hypothetical protein
MENGGLRSAYYSGPLESSVAIRQLPSREVIAVEHREETGYQLYRLSGFDFVPVGTPRNTENLPLGFSLSEDGTRMAVGSDRLHIWSVTELGLVPLVRNEAQLPQFLPALSLSGPTVGGLSYVLLNRDGTRLLTYQWNANVRLWSVSENGVQEIGPAAPTDVAYMTLTQDQAHAVIFSRDGVMRFWRITDAGLVPGQEIPSEYGDRTIQGGVTAHFNGDRMYLADGTGALHIFRARDRKVIVNPEALKHDSENTASIAGLGRVRDAGVLESWYAAPFLGIFAGERLRAGLTESELKANPDLGKMRISERMLVATGSLLFALGCVMGGWMLAMGAVSWWVSSGLAFSLAHRDRTGLASLKLFAVGMLLAMVTTLPAVIFSWGMHSGLAEGWMAIAVFGLAVLGLGSAAGTRRSTSVSPERSSA